MSNATDKARRLGWRITPEEYSETYDPHAPGEKCKCKRNSLGVCPCLCHGIGGSRALGLRQRGAR